MVVIDSNVLGVILSFLSVFVAFWIIKLGMRVINHFDSKAKEKEELLTDIDDMKKDIAELNCRYHYLVLSKSDKRKKGGTKL